MPQTMEPKTMESHDLFDEELSKDIIGKEGAYSNNKDDAGGETMWGITIGVAREEDYNGPMRDMPRAEALRIYKQKYWIKPGFHLIAPLSPRIAAELFDTGVNMGIGIPGPWLQRALNALNRKGSDYPDIIVDGKIGPATVSALNAFLRVRGGAGVEVIMKILNAFQAVRYVELSEKREANETFTFGWLDKRVNMG